VTLARWRAWTGQLALALASLALGLGLLEGWARWEQARPRPAAKQNERAEYTDFHPLLGWVKRPGARVVYRRPEYTVEVAINSRGLRDPERGAGPRDVPRVLALGDSFVEGYTVPLEDTVTQALERALGSAGCRSEVINAGTGGYSTDQEYLFYREEGVRYAPEVVLLFFFHNDVPANAQVNYFGARKPRFVSGAGGLVPLNLPLSPPAGRKPAAEPPADGGPPQRWHGSAFLEWMRQRLAGGAPATYNQLARLGWWPRLRREPTDALQVYQRSPPPRVSEGWRVTRALLAELQAEVTRHGSRLLLVYVPNRFEVDDGAWARSREVYGMDEGGWDRHAPAERLRTMAGKLRLPLVDLTPPLRAAQGALAPPTYFQLDGHWTARGHRVAAQALASRLTEPGWLPGCGG